MSEQQFEPTPAAEAAEVNAGPTARVAIWSWWRSDRLIFGFRGKRCYPLALLFGLAAAAGMPPYYFLPGLVFGFSGLTLLLAAAGGRRRIFLSVWLFAFGYFLLGLYWVANALLVDAGKFGWLWPFAVVLLPAVLSFFPALVITLLSLLLRPGSKNIAWFLILVVGWALSDYFRGILFTGFPWHALGYAWTFSDVGMQIFALGGVPLAGLLTIAAAAVPATLLGPGRTGWAWTWLPFVLIAGLVAAMLVFGNLRLALAPKLAYVPDVRLRIVQPNIAQKDKWRPELLDAHLANLMQLSSSTGYRRITHVIWPETAPPFNFIGDHERRKLVAALAPKQGRLISGVVYLQRHNGQRQVRNAVVTVKRSGEVEQIYNKVHLVPFGEYLPFRPILQRFGLDKLVAGLGDFVAGRAAKLMTVPGLPAFRPLICYEVIFPGEVRSPSRPGWLLNVTNDAWYGDSAGPRQHFELARVRAVELGVPLVRAANTGVSGVVDPYGRVLAKLDLMRRGVVDHALPVRIAPTPYTRFTNIGFFLLIVFGVFTLFFNRLRYNPNDEPLDIP